MYRAGLNCFLSLLLIACCVAIFPAFAQEKAGPYDKLAGEILVLVNAHRTGMGLKPLAVNQQIVTIAEGHSRNMAARKVPFGHQGFDARMNKLEKLLAPANSFAENVEFGPTEAKEAVELWLTSEGHRKNIEGDFNLTGIGIARSKNGDLFYTQIFVKKGR